MTHRVRSLVTEYDIREGVVYDAIEIDRLGFEGYVTVIDDAGDYWPLTRHEYIFLEGKE